MNDYSRNRSTNFYSRTINFYSRIMNVWPNYHESLKFMVYLFLGHKSISQYWLCYVWLFIWQINPICFKIALQIISLKRFGVEHSLVMLEQVELWLFTVPVRIVSIFACRICNWVRMWLGLLSWLLEALHLSSSPPWLVSSVCGFSLWLCIIVAGWLVKSTYDRKVAGLIPYT